MTSTAKNYAGQNLRGSSFNGQDLSGSDFSDTDLRGANFTGATLIGANFSKAKTGIQKRWLIFQLIIAFIVFSLSGIIGAAIAYFVFNVSISTTNIGNVFGISSIISFVVIISVTIRQGFTSKYFLDLYISVVILGILGIFLLYIISTFKSNTVGFKGGILVNIGNLLGFAAMSYSIVAALMIVTFMTGVAAVAVMKSVDVSINKITLLAVISIVLSAYIAEVLSGFSASAGTIAVYLLGIYYSYCALSGNPKFEILHKYALIFSTIGGTKFRSANLTNSDFTEASLNSSDFRNSQDNITNLTRTIWKQARDLNRSRLGSSILANPEVRELLVTGKPNQSKSYEGLNLRGANLDGVYLENVNFKRAILSEASFRNTNLEWVNLTEAQAIGTDFTGAQMTGVCLEGWSYDHTTKLDDVDCRFVFELEHPNAKGSRERRPHDPDKEFAEGDFTKRYSETLNVVQLLIRNGINREAFIAAWENLTKEYPDINPDDIQEIKKKVKMSN